MAVIYVAQECCTYGACMSPWFILLQLFVRDCVQHRSDRAVQTLIRPAGMPLLCLPGWNSRKCCILCSDSDSVDVRAGATALAVLLAYGVHSGTCPRVCVSVVVLLAVFCVYCSLLPGLLMPIHSCCSAASAQSIRPVVADW